MIKMLYEKGVLDIKKILIEEYQNLDLTIPELTLLLFLFHNYNNKTFSSNQLAKQMKFSKNEVELILEALMTKDLFSLSQDTQNNKIIEIFSLDNVLQKIEDIYQQRTKKIKTKEIHTYIKETIAYLEEAKGSILFPYEYEIIKSWYDEKKYTHAQILKIVKQIDPNKNSLTYIDRILNQQYLEVKNNNQADQFLQKLFEKIK